jgi:endonuclease III
MRRPRRAQTARKAKETPAMAQIDKQAAQKELREAAHLRAKAGLLVEIADELEQEAERHEHDAQDLVAPAKASLSSAGGRR